MTVTLETVTKKRPEPTAEQVAAEELVRRAREQGLSLTGPDGLLKQLTKVVIETALDQEMTEHLGHERNTPAGNETGNVRNGSRAKTVLTEGTGQVGIEVPRDRDGTFEPQIVRRRQRRLGGVDEIVLSLYAKGLTTGEISAHFAEIYGASVSKETVSRDKVDDAVVESARGAVPVLLPVRFPGPLAEPGVRLSAHRALHGGCRQALWRARLTTRG
jgi:putative transposase